MRSTVALGVALAVLRVPARASTEPPTVTPDAAQRAVLEAGGAVHAKIHGGPGEARRAVLFVVDAEPARVWRAICAFESYPEWVNGVAEIEVYAEAPHRYAVRFAVTHWLAGRFGYHVRHHYPWPGADWGTFELDAERPSDLAESVGFWRVVVWPGDVAGETQGEAGGERSLVTYAAHVFPGGWLATVVGAAFTNAALEDASRWLRERAPALPPAAVGSVARTCRGAATLRAGAPGTG